LVQLELRGVAAGVPVAARQSASEGVHVRVCARAHGCKQMHPVSSNDQTVAAQRGGAPSCERRSTVRIGLPSGGLVDSHVCMPKGIPRRRAPGGTEKETTRPCALSTEDNMVKGGALVGFLGAARTTVKHQSGGAAFSLPACSHRRISAPGGARAWLRAPKGDASQRARVRKPTA
jgi:hypothetical protein